MSDTFFQEAQEIASSKRTAKNNGRNLVTWQSVGVFFHPDTPAAIRSKLCVHKPNEQEWEALILARYEREKSESPSPAKSEPLSSKPITINRN